VVLAVVIITGLLATQLQYLHVEIRRRDNLPNQHPYVQVQNRISDLFGGEAVVLIGIIANQGSIYTPQVLGKIYRITERIRQLPSAIEPSIFSIAAPNARAVTGTDGSLDVHALMPEPPNTRAEAEQVRSLVRNDRLLQANLVSSDDTAAVIVADFDGRLKDSDLARSVSEIVARERDDTVTIALAGAPILNAALGRYVAMMAFLFPLAVVVIGVVHYEAFRTLQAMLLPLVTALLSVVWALAIMGWLRQPIDTWTAISPVLILAIAAGHSVQLLKRYYEELLNASELDSSEAVVRSIVAVGPVMLMAGGIAAAGFASLMGFGIISVRGFGLLLALGIVCALIIEMTFTPACRCLLPNPKSIERTRESRKRWLDRLLDVLGRTVVAQPKIIISITVITVVLALIGAMRMRVDNSFRLWFSPGTQLRLDDALLNEKLPGTASLRILVEGGKDDVLLQPDVLRAISDFEDEILRDGRIGGVTSIADHVKRIEQAMHNGDLSEYTIPNDSKVIGEYLFLYSASTGPDGLSAFVDPRYRRTVIRALSKTDSAAFSRELLHRLQVYADERFRGLPVAVGIAGGTLGVQTAMNDLVVHEKIINILQVAAVIFVLCALVLRSVLGALFVLIPLAIGMAVNFGVMGSLGVWLDMSTAAITAMGVSIGADFAIYQILRMREEWRRSTSLESAVLSSMRTSGKAIFYVSSAITVGYMILAVSGFSIWMRLGLLTALAVSTSALATLTVVPALIVVFKPQFLSAPVEDTLARSSYGLQASLEVPGGSTPI
jgi:uncharacterized protein